MAFLLLAGAAPPLCAQTGRLPLSDLSTVNGYAFTADMQTVLVSLRVPLIEANGRQRAQIFARRRTPSGWSQPQSLSFTGGYTDYQPIWSPDRNRLFFTSTRPISEGGPEARQNVWMVPFDGERFGEARPISELIDDGWDGYAVEVNGGSLYYVSERAGGRGGTDIWYSRRTAQGYAAPTNVAEVNSAHSDSDIYVDPAERYMIFNRHVEATGEIDLFASFRRGGRWSEPVPINAVNRPGWELSPTVTPDDRWLIFQRNGRPEQHDWAAIRAGLSAN